MERETTIFKTTGGVEVELKTYATARENIQIQEVYLKGAKMEFEGVKPNIKEIDPTIQFAVERKLIETFVVSVNGSKEKILDTILDGKSDDYNEIIKKIDSLVAKKKS